MSLITDSSRRNANSDAWLDDLASDTSGSSDVQSAEAVKRVKADYAWQSATSTRNVHSDDEEDEVEDEERMDEVGDEDDADDEDWVASDYDRKRIQRPGVQRHPHSSLKTAASGKSCHHHQQRVRHKPSLSSPRPSQQTQLNCGPPRSGRSGSQHIKSQNRVKSSVRDNMQSSSTSRRGTRRNAPNSPNRCPLPCELAEPRQCFGPGCTRTAARPDTKYCSEECGLRLAFRRLEVLLPERLQRTKPGDPETNETDSQKLPELDYLATRLDRARLEEIQIEKSAVHDKLVQLEMDHQHLTNLIARARERKPDLLAEATNEADQAEQMEPVVCVTCASEVSMRHALRHMEKCFQKMEGNTVFCANQKEQVVGTPLFCDAYDTQAKAYCKRLRVVCEHFKEPKLPPDTVCGFPLVRDVFVESGSFCCVPRNKCTRHLGWERLRRASIDIERYRYFIKMDDLLQEEQRIHQAISQRGGILGVLLHQTVDHNPSKPVPLPVELRARGIKE
ncbi:CXXC-type zinc finger protein 1 [Clonorchis sinensis]|uniref:CXXC-type zinc finger protein 1 n=1 Tax=Clonorchis sinensis TaxID=79923 RepID=A0A8T1MM91_CLOSI|nr:CXXC-type zinc finger protein 1 [Clonorchis sinensis]